ncbi:MAG: hypothetical protein CMK09_08925 [Ponticaulis sp.]|nr:hypothetical protein [Ponticaulis sp.]
MFSQKTSKPVNQDRILLSGNKAVLAIGDIHGRLDLLERLFKECLEVFKPADFEQMYYVFLGDYIDRGPQSKGVIESLIRTSWKKAKPVFLMGNHEQSFLNFLDGASGSERWLRFGGRETLSSYGVDVPLNANFSEDELKDLRDAAHAALPKTHLKFLQDLQVSFELDNCFFAHAGVDPDRPLHGQNDDDLMWIRDKFLNGKKPLDMVVVHGHSPETAPVWDGRRIGLDTGAYVTNKLSAGLITHKAVRFIST